MDLIKKSYIFENICDQNVYNKLANQFNIKNLQLTRVLDKAVGRIYYGIIRDQQEIIPLALMIYKDQHIQFECKACGTNKSCQHIIHFIHYLNILNHIDILTPNSDFKSIHQQAVQLLIQVDHEKNLIQKDHDSLIAITTLSKKIEENVIDKIIDKEQTYRIFLNSLNTQGVMTIDFKIGDDKQYMIKDLKQFVNFMLSETSYRYGKSLLIKHQEALFDDFSIKQIQFIIKQAYQNLIYHQKYIQINDMNLDAFFDLYARQDFQYTQIKFKVMKIRLELNVMQHGDMYEIYLVNERYKPIRYSSKYCYIIGDDEIIRLEDTSNGILKEMYALITTGKLEQMNETSLIQLIRMIEDYQEYFLLHFKTNNLIELDQTSNNQVGMFLDLYDDSLLIEFKILDDTENWVIIENETKLSKSIQTIIHYLKENASHVENYKIYYQLSSADAEDLIYSNLNKYQDFVEVYVSEAIKQISKPKKIIMQPGVRIKNGLLEIDLKHFEYSIHDLKQMMNAYQRNKKYIRLKNGEVIDLEQKLFSDLNDTFDSLNIDVNQIHSTIHLPLYRAYAIENTETIQYNFQQSYYDLIERLESLNEVEKLNPNYLTVLRPYQIEGVEWLLKLRQFNFGGILADDMGLGKTLQVIALLDSVTKEKDVIIIVPATLLYNWKDEFNRFAPHLNTICIHGNKSNRRLQVSHRVAPSILITTYDYIRLDYDLYESIQFEYVILDEGQYIKNFQTKVAKSVKRLSSLHRIILTGTPIENNLSELWSLFDFIMPDYLYHYQHFQRYFERLIFKENELVQNKLKKLVKPFILSRTKTQVLNELPSKTEIIQYIDFTEDERHFYLSKLSSFNDQLAKQTKEEHPLNKVVVLSMLMQLRQICCDTRLLNQNAHFESSKLKACMLLIESLLKENKKILLFSSFTTMLDIIETELEDRGISLIKITGRTTKEERRKRVNQFQGGGASIFLISLKAGGVGLNLTKANVVIHFDPWWNLSTENQATDRAHRMGQLEKVQVYKLIVKHSIEDKILKMQEHKKGLSDFYIEGSNGSLSNMDLDDIRELFYI